MIKTHDQESLEIHVFGNTESFLFLVTYFIGTINNDFPTYTFFATLPTNPTIIGTTSKVLIFHIFVISVLNP